MSADINSQFARATKMVIVVERTRFFDDRGMNKWDGGPIRVSSLQVEGMTGDNFVTHIQNIINRDAEGARQNPVPLQEYHNIGALEYYIRAEGLEFPFLRISLFASHGDLSDKAARDGLIADAIRNGRMEAEFGDIPLTMVNFLEFRPVERAI